MRWGKPTKNRKKHRDPRYFLDEAVVGPGLTVGGEDRQGMSIGGAGGVSREVEEPEADRESDVLAADQRLSSSDLGVLQWILEDLQTGTGRGNMAERFLDVMDKLGVDLGDSDTGTDSQQQASAERKQRLSGREQERYKYHQETGGW